MKTASVRDLRNHYTKLLTWIAAGEEIVITQRGKAIARLSPMSDAADASVDWSQSPAIRRDRTNEPVLTAAESSQLLAEAGEQW